MSLPNLVRRLAEMIPFKLRNHIRNIPLLKQVQQFMVSRWLNKNSFIATISGGPAKGLVFPVQMPQDKLMWLGTWELGFAEAMRAIIQPGWVCYDVGGYKGYYAGLMALQGAREVFVFEPMPENAAIIENLISLNPSLPILLKKLALSDSTGEVLFKVMPDATMGKLKESTFEEEAKPIIELTVSSTSIDELIKNGIPEPDFIKIDVEGAEELVLRGAAELLQRRKPLIMLEVHSQEIGQRCYNFLMQYYKEIKVLETGREPGTIEHDICHYLLSN